MAMAGPIWLSAISDKLFGLDYQPFAIGYQLFE